MKIYNYLLDSIKAKGAAYLILLDPDKIHNGRIKDFVNCAESSGADAFLIGSSLMLNNDFEEFVGIVKSVTKLPAIIFPGAIDQITPKADAILYISVISGRNADHLIGKHVLSAPLIKRSGVEPISTGYILVESGTSTTAQYMSGSFPIPRNKPEIAAATALAAEYMGMKFIYLEAGSGALQTVPDEMVKAVSSYCSVPVIVGGGIKSPKEASDKVRNGAKIIVTGNFFENENNWELIKDFADSIHDTKGIEAKLQLNK
ncbi:MAG TPA: geranylgeranylglyceryl/heptaprenylglyceryl phosphate synthase [Ignavibacteriaceae bacterium]|nr:geranylgeranylglyceryl/heptaprenylglyceryl phosphate synthase [Ignavibacteriaceae bacterium]